MLPISALTLGNLTDLQLKANDKWYMSIVKLASVLASCPKLRLLSLDGISIDTDDSSDDSVSSSDDWDPSDNSNVKGQKLGVVFLNNLLVLDIGGLTSLESTVRILELVNPGPNVTTMGLPLFEQNSISTAQLFPIVIRSLDRSKATTLHLYGSLKKPSFATQIGSLPHVETLVFHRCHFSTSAKVDSSWSFESPITYDNSDSFASALVFWPKLASLHLHLCYLEMSEVLDLASSHSIQSLSIWDCYEAHEGAWKKRIDTQTSWEYVRRLSEVVPETVYVQDGSDDWPSLSEFTPGTLDK